MKLQTSCLHIHFSIMSLFLSPALWFSKLSWNAHDETRHLAEHGAARGEQAQALPSRHVWPGWGRSWAVTARSGRSASRKVLGVGDSGWAATWSWLGQEVFLQEVPQGGDLEVLQKGGRAFRGWAPGTWRVWSSVGAQSCCWIRPWGREEEGAGSWTG